MKKLIGHDSKKDYYARGDQKKKTLKNNIKSKRVSTSQTTLDRVWGDFDWIEITKI